MYEAKGVVRAFRHAGVELHDLTPGGTPAEWSSGHGTLFYAGAVGATHVSVVVLPRDDATIVRGHFGEPEEAPEQKFQRANVVAFVADADSDAVERVRKALDRLDR